MATETMRGIRYVRSRSRQNPASGVVWSTLRRSSTRRSKSVRPRPSRSRRRSPSEPDRSQCDVAFATRPRQMRGDQDVRDDRPDPCDSLDSRPNDVCTTQRLPHRVGAQEATASRGVRARHVEVPRGHQIASRPDEVDDDTQAAEPRVLGDDVEASPLDDLLGELLGAPCLRGVALAWKSSAGVRGGRIGRAARDVAFADAAATQRPEHDRPPTSFTPLLGDLGIRRVEVVPDGSGAQSSPRPPSAVPDPMNGSSTRSSS